MSEIIFPFDTQKFFDKCVKNKNFPKNDFEKQTILLRILKDFDDQKYQEDAVNDIIKKYFDDHALIRRELINFGYMHRDPYRGEYKVIKRTLTKEDISKNIRLKRHAEAFKVLKEDK